MKDPGRDTLIPAADNRRMFDRIARRYDLLNAIMSFGLHRFWRRKALESLFSIGCACDSPHYLDLGCGTGDVAIAVLKKDPAVRITGIDLSAGMIKIADRKTRAAGLQSRAAYHIGDAMALPFGKNTFDGVVSAFCVRNIENRGKAFLEMKRVLRPGGSVVILELTRPTAPLPRLVHRFHTHGVIPLLGALLSQRSAYRYLADSIEHFPPPDSIVSEMANAGFVEVRHMPLTGGLVTLFMAQAPKCYVFAAPEYANSVPLARYIPAVSPDSRVVLNTPSQLLAPLVNGEVDAALIPVAALFANPTLIALEGTGICAEKKVRSVVLRCNRPLDQVRTVCLDPASRTSNALAQVLLKHHWKRDIQIVASANDADASVVIGDRALCESPGPGGDHDLATAWNQMTGLPFVFAVWAVRRNHPDRAGLTRVIQAAKQAGIAAISGIVREQAQKLGLSETTCLEYFAECIYYDLGPRERQAMERFRIMLAELC